MPRVVWGGWLWLGDVGSLLTLVTLVALVKVQVKWNDSTNERNHKPKNKRKKNRPFGSKLNGLSP